MGDLARMISVLHYCVGVKQAVKQVVLRPEHCGLCVERRGSCVCMNDGDYIAVCLSLNLVEWHVRTVASLLGHAQASTTLDIYAHAFDKNKRKAQEKLGKAIGL